MMPVDAEVPVARYAWSRDGSGPCAALSTNSKLDCPVRLPLDVPPAPGICLPRVSRSESAQTTFLKTVTSLADGTTHYDHVIST